MTAPLLKNLVCTVGAVAVSLTFMTAAAGPAHAALARVSVADLDLSKTAGVETLTRRVKAAAETVCANDGRTAREQRARRRCLAATIDDAFMLAPTRA